MHPIKVFITIFTNEQKLETFWFNLFESYQLTPKTCHRLSHLMLALFAPITYPAFEVLNLIKYTRRRLQLNEFLESDKDLGRFHAESKSLSWIYGPLGPRTGSGPQIPYIRSLS